MIKINRNLLLAAAVLIMAAGCSAHPAAIKKNPEAITTTKGQMTSDYFITTGDELEIKFFYNPELNEAVLVRPDGKISLQLIDEIQASGLTPSQLDKVLTEKYSKELKKPVITVIVRSFSGRQVYVGGEVNTQGLIDLIPGMTALQAVIGAEGFRESAKPDAAIVIRKGLNGSPIPIRIDLNNAIYGKGDGATFQLQPYDIVYVPKSSIAKANKFVKQYIEELLLFRGVSFGFSYQVHDAGPDD